MRPEEIAYANLCLAVWEMGWRLWWERWAVEFPVFPGCQAAPLTTEAPR